MRFAVAALAGIFMMVDARNPSKYAIKKTRAMRDKLERIHGRGMVGLYDENDEFRVHRLSKGLKGYHQKKRAERLGATISIDGIDGTFELDSWIVEFLGTLDGFTYSEVQGESNAIANCFISGYSIVENIDSIIYIFNNAG